MSPDPVLLARLEEAAEEATEGPWEVAGETTVVSDSKMVAKVPSPFPADASFVAAAGRPVMVHLRHRYRTLQRRPGQTCGTWFLQECKVCGHLHEGFVLLDWPVPEDGE